MTRYTILSQSQMVHYMLNSSNNDLTSFMFSPPMNVIVCILALRRATSFTFSLSYEWPHSRSSSPINGNINERYNYHDIQFMISNHITIQTHGSTYINFNQNKTCFKYKSFILFLDLLKISFLWVYFILYQHESVLQFKGFIYINPNKI